MRDFDGFMHSVIAALVGSVAGILFASFLLSARGAAASRLSWDDLGSIATFWGGHLTALSILIIGAGLFIQARQLRTQIQAERDQARRSRLEWLTSQLPALGANLWAYHVDDSTRPPEVKSFNGLQQFAAAVLDKPHDLAEIEVWTDALPLMSYAQVAKEIQRIADELDGEPQEPNGSMYTFVYHGGVCNYAAQMLQARSKVLSEMRQLVQDETVLLGVATMVQQGWRIECSSVQGRHYISARHFDPVLRRVDVLRADDASLTVSSKLLVEKWTATYQ